MSGADVTVIIPAYNEAAVLGRTMDSLAAQDEIGQVKVVVVPNGCSDDTEAVARRYADRIPHLSVLPLDRPSKTNALNVAEATAPPGARIYLDADIELSPGLLRAMLRALDTDGPLLVCPRVEFDSSGAGAVPRAFYDVFSRLQDANPTMTSGLYGVSAAGRSRFAEFPPVEGDDTFVKRQFEEGERVWLPEHFVVRTPRDAAGLLRMRTRIARGNAELAGRATARPDGTNRAMGTAPGTLAALAQLVRGRPALAGRAALYVGVVTAARLRAVRTRRTDGRVWERDDSSRRAGTLDLGRDEPATGAWS